MCVFAHFTAPQVPFFSHAMFAYHIYPLKVKYYAEDNKSYDIKSSFKSSGITIKYSELCLTPPLIDKGV